MLRLSIKPFLFAATLVSRVVYLNLFPLLNKVKPFSKVLESIRDCELFEQRFTTLRYLSFLNLIQVIEKQTIDYCGFDDCGFSDCGFMTVDSVTLDSVTFYSSQVSL